MPKGTPRKRPPLTDEDILKYVNVPTEIAARYIDWSNQAVRAALREGSIPVGSASQPSDRQWSYNIIAPALVKYRHGEIQAYNPKRLEDALVDGVQRMLDAKLCGLSQVLQQVMGA